mmetsp:Transcript_14535/g.40400  ORF Transcript_14535/g.40400 Transcript_14535/m.40400 type:complete len:366 (+) Transcript_14535:200-1297(+)
MCSSSDALSKESVNSGLCGSDGSDSDDTNDSVTERRCLREMRFGEDCGDTTTTSSSSSSVLTGILHGIGWMVVAMNLPFYVSGEETFNKIYLKAFYDYDPKISLFDNTIWTYGSDYVLAVMTAGTGCWILWTSNRADTVIANKLAWVSAAMLFLYAISVTTGGIAHHTFLTVESRNSLSFRVLWTICVGTVYMAPMAMGMIANECLRIFQSRSNCPPLLKQMPCLMDSYWLCYGAVGTMTCICGYMSYQRPACDIFIAAITQTPCTFYFMGILYLLEDPVITNGVKIPGLIGFIINAFLLPLYPALVVTFGWSLGGTNALLHTNLFIAWFLQGLTLQRIVKALVEETGKEARQNTISPSKQKKVQ